jgi:hypothetical protein
MGEVEAGEDDDGSGRVTLTPFGRWTHDMGSQPTPGTFPKGYFLFLYFTHWLTMTPPYYSPYKLGEQGKSTLGWCLGVVGPGRKTPPPGVPGSCKIDDVAKGYADDAIIVLQEGILPCSGTP